MEDAFLVSSVQPWFANVGKRVIKSPKVYQRDSGILHAWLGLGIFDNLLGNNALGASWEGYVIEQIKNVARDRLSYFFYGTHQGAECDMVLVKGGRPVAGVEIKFSSAPVLSKGFYIATNDLNTPVNFVVVPDATDYQMKENLWVVGISSFLKHHLPLLWE